MEKFNGGKKLMGKFNDENWTRKIQWKINGENLMGKINGKKQKYLMENQCKNFLSK